MKLSNIILISFSVLFIAYIFGIAAEIRFRGEERKPFGANPVQQVEECATDFKTDFKNEVPLPSFKVLKIKKISEVAQITFNATPDNLFTVFAASEAELPELEFHKSGDTLIIGAMNRKSLCNFFKLQIAESETEIIVDSMSINLSFISDNLKTLGLKGSNTSFTFIHTSGGFEYMDSLHVNLKDHSALRSVVDIKSLSGEISNQSALNLGHGKVESARVKIGASSGMKVNGKVYQNPDSSAHLIYSK